MRPLPLALAGLVALAAGALITPLAPPAAATDTPRPRGNPDAPRCEGCGCKGGPGYRKPNGDCVGWKQIFTVRGSPPSTCCTPEIADPRAPEIAAPQKSPPKMPRAQGHERHVETEN
jgi:hypothetical protein